MNDQNLRSLSTRTPEERQAIARAGGIASGIARRRKRAEAEEMRRYEEEQERLRAIAEAKRRMNLEALKQSIFNPRRRRR